MKTLTVMTLLSTMALTNISGTANGGQLVSAIPFEAVSNLLNVEKLVGEEQLVFLNDETDTDEVEEVGKVEVEPEEFEVNYENEEVEEEVENEIEDTEVGENEDEDFEYDNEQYGVAPIYDGSNYISSDETAINDEWYEMERERIDGNDEEVVWGYESDDEVIYDEDIPYDDEGSDEEFDYDIGEMENIHIDNIEEFMSESVEFFHIS
ncbi:MAG: hypothetical protein SOZ81_05075 [Agathobacter sp.]|nr:hypothetical protein [Agathobacter sp.]